MATEREVVAGAAAVELAWGPNLPMPLHREIFTSFFFSLQTRACGLTRASKKSHFRHVAPIVSPFRPSIPIIPPPHPLAPPPNVHPKACDACVAGGGLGGGATAMRRRGGEGHDGDNDDDDDAAVAADGEDDERLRR